MMDKALQVVQFIYYFGLCLALVFAVISFMFGPAIARFAGWAAIFSISCCILALGMVAFQKWRGRRNPNQRGT